MHGNFFLKDCQSTCLCIATSLYKDLKRYKEAEDTFAECERQGLNTSRNTLHTRGTNYLAMNDTERARVFLGRALEMGATDESTRVNYGG